MTKSPTAPLAPTPEQEVLYHEYAELSHKIVKRPLVVFFGRPTFSDNTKYLFLATRKAAAGCEVIWAGFHKPLLAALRAKGFDCLDLAGDPRQVCNVLLEAAV